MVERETYGIAVLLIGLVIIGITFYLAYGLYGMFISLAASPTQQNAPIPPANVSSTSGIVDAVISGVVSSIPSGKFLFYVLALLVLLIMANIGYKFARIGLSLMPQGKDSTVQQQAQQRKNKF